MSNYLAIAAVTATLKSLLAARLPDDEDLPGNIDVTTKPLDKAGTDTDGNLVNIFLFQVLPNPALRNLSAPGTATTSNGGSVSIAHLSPAALDLQYLITVYGENDDTTPDNHSHRSHRLLGKVVSVLQDHAILDRERIKSVLPNNDLYQQIEGIRITPDSLSLDDLTKVWNSFQTGYRLSVAYRIGVILIDSRLPSRQPLPVIGRGQEDRGAFAVASPSPSLRGMRLPNDKPSAQFGDALTILGNHLNNDDLQVRLRHPLLEEPIELPPESERSPGKLRIKLPTSDESDPDYYPELPSTWAAGFYTLSLVVQRPELPGWTTNEVSFALSPQITNINPRRAPHGDVTLTLTCKPQIRKIQQVVLLFGERMIPVESLITPDDPTASTTLTFKVKDAEARPNEPYVLRLRIDGVESIPVSFEGDPPQFDDNQKVEIT